MELYRLRTGSSVVLENCLTGGVDNIANSSELDRLNVPYLAVLLHYCPIRLTSRLFKYVAGIRLIGSRFVQWISGSHRGFSMACSVNRVAPESSTAIYVLLHSLMFVRLTPCFCLSMM